MFELGVLESTYPGVLATKFANKFENIKYRIRLRVYSKTLFWALHTTPNLRTKSQLCTDCISGDTVLTDERTDRYKF